MKPKVFYAISAVVFIVLLLSVAVSTVYINQVAIGWKNQDTVIDNITDGLNRLLYILNMYSANETTGNATQPLNSIAKQIDTNITALVSYDLNERLLVQQLQDCMNQLRPLANQIVASKSQGQLLTSIWNNIFSIIQQLQSITQRISAVINEQIGNSNQTVFILMFSFITMLVVFVCFLYFQIFGRTIKSTEKLESLVEERTNQLHDAERMAIIGQTAGMVGHDIRNPLQAINGDAFLLKAALDDIYDNKKRAEAKESLNAIETNVLYINRIVADLQDLSRPLKPEYTIFDLYEVICALFTGVLIPDDIKLSIDVKDLPKLRSDATFIRRALTNLVNNAIQAMPNGGSLNISGYQKQEKIVITVSDTGIGIPEEVKPKLFTPMATTKSRGHGLGLAVVKRLVEALDGKIFFESEEGKGTKFIIELPS